MSFLRFLPVAIALTGLLAWSTVVVSDQAVGPDHRAFTPVFSIEGVPEPVLEWLDEQTGERMAEFGEEFAGGCVRLGNEPRRRFALAGYDAATSLWILAYEHGGRGHHLHVALIEVSDGSVSVKSHGSWNPPLEHRFEPLHIQQLTEAVRNGFRNDDHW